MVCTTSSQQAQQASHVLRVGPHVTAMMTCLPTCQPSSKTCSAQLALCTFLPCALAWHASGLQFTDGELAPKPSVQPKVVCFKFCRLQALPAWRQPCSNFCFACRPTCKQFEPSP